LKLTKYDFAKFNLINIEVN